jgi:hypothetical protein
LDGGRWESKKLAKAEAREERHRGRVVRWQNRIGGAPTPEVDSG